MRIGVLSDTHIPSRAKALPGTVPRALEGSSAVFHAGDFVEAPVFEELKGLAPLAFGVLGNCDSAELAALVPATASIELAGLKIGMIHDSGPAAGKRQRMRELFPGHRVVIFGHSHRPLIEDDGDLLLLNPGSACDPRWARIPTVATLEIREGSPRAELIEL